MSIPSTDRIEYPASTLGIESQPQGILAKSTLWTLQLGYSRLFLKEYGGSRHELDNLIVKNYILTAALKMDLSIDPDRLWVWIVDLQNNLSLYEFEPYTASIPVFTYSKLNIATDINYVSISVSSLSPIRIAALYNTNEFKSIGYENIRLLDPPVIGDLKWEGSRLNQFDIYSYSDRTALEITYLDVASPPNVYIESYTLAVPSNLSVSQVDDTNEILLSWDAVVDADSYVIDRDTDPAFLTPVSVTTPLLTISDFVPATGTYYYRVRAVNDSLLLWSPWSGKVQITLSVSADFYGVPLSAFIGDIITFTDISTPSGTITSWDWDFGDGSSHSTLQNPTHIYSTPGIYTVTLIAYSLSEYDTIIKIDYISITPALLAAFIGDPLIGDANLSVGFTDESLGYPISWDWDFGDGSSHSFVKNPNHVYTKAGLHTVSLTVNDGINESTTTNVDYVSVNMVADFLSNIQTGPADLIVSFSDSTLGEPTHWDWDFGDGTPHSTVQNPIHIYISADNYTITLIAYNSEASDTIIKVDYITVASTANFYAEPRTGYSTLSAQFIDLSKGYPSTWYWDFGDSNFSTEQNPVHFYNSPGEYTVTLVASSLFNSASETKAGYIIVSGIATPDIAPEPDKLMYLSEKVDASRNNSGIKIRYNNITY